MTMLKKIFFILAVHYQDFKIIENSKTLCFNKEEMQAKFQEHFIEAEPLVKETGYHRRDKEVEELRNTI